MQNQEQTFRGWSRAANNDSNRFIFVSGEIYSIVRCKTIQNQNWMPPYQFGYYSNNRRNIRDFRPFSQYPLTSVWVQLKFSTPLILHTHKYWAFTEVIPKFVTYYVPKQAFKTGKQATVLKSVCFKSHWIYLAIFRLLRFHLIHSIVLFAKIYLLNCWFQEQKIHCLIIP